jgi:EmrB/QacA subfamily drug resistance transporter
MSVSEASTAEAPPAVPANVRWTLLGVMLAMLLAVLDTNVVGTAMPTIVGDLGGLGDISWVVTTYALATAVSTPIWGKLGDLYGRKRLFLGSIAGFLAGSALCGTAWSMPSLIGFRALQGAGAGGLAAGALALIGSLVPPRERGRYQGMTAIVMAVGTVAGPWFGGLRTEHLGWRAAFFVNLPLGVIALVWVAVLLHLPAVRGRARIDGAGMLLLTVAITALTLGASWAGSTYAWSSWPIVALAVLAVASIAGFAAWEKRAAAPVLPPRMFTRQRNFPLSIGTLAAVGAVMFGCTLYVPLFQQTVQGASAAGSGLLLLPMALPVAIISTLAGKYISRTGRYRILPILGTALLTAGTFLLSTMDTGTSFALTSVYLAVIGAGLGLTMQVSGTIAQNSAEPEDMGAASAAITLFRTLGGSVGVAVFGGLLTSSTTNAAPPVYHQALAAGTSHIFLLASAVCAAAFVLACCVKEVPLRK